MFCGIDISKDKSNVCILDKNKRVIKEFEINHNKEGFDKLEKHLTQETKIGMETTGNYSKTLYSFLRDKYDVSYIDNSQMYNYAKMRYPHLKNDRVDAKLIAEFLSFGFKKIKPVKVEELKDICRLYYKTMKQLIKYKFMYKDQLSIIFPELGKKLCLHKTKGVPYMLLKYPTPEHILKATEEEIYKALVENLKVSSFYNSDYVKKIKELAKDSVGVKDYPVICFKHTIKIMLFYQKLIEDLLKGMKKGLSKTPYYSLLEEYGYSVPSLSMIVGEVGDIRRFPNHKKFVKYVGFDVSQKQSGNYNSVNCYITKQGNRQLRHMFYTMVLPHLAAKNKFKDFYQGLKERGKHPMQCMIATARKLAVRAYFDLMKCHNEGGENEDSENTRGIS